MRPDRGPPRCRPGDTGVSPGGGREGEADTARLFCHRGRGGTHRGLVCFVPGALSLAQCGGQVFAKYTDGGETEARSNELRGGKSDRQACPRSPTPLRRGGPARVCQPQQDAPPLDPPGSSHGDHDTGGSPRRTGQAGGRGAGAGPAWIPNPPGDPGPAT